MTISLIRHGKTAANENKLYAGVTDLPLSEQGACELLALRGQINYPTAQLYLCSGLVRTAQTLEILYDIRSVITVPDLREISFGDFEMLGYEQLRLKPEYQGWIADIDNNSPPKGESKADFTIRVARGMEQVKEICELSAVDSAVIVTHGGVIAVIMESLFPQQRGFYEWQPQCGRGYTVSKADTENKIYTKI